jgi:hypothetical protein
VTDKRKALACDKIWPIFVNYESVKFYSTGPRPQEFIPALEKRKLKEKKKLK